MAIKVGGTTVIDDSRNVCNAAQVNATTVCATNLYGNGSGITGLATAGGGELVCGTTSYTLTCSNQRSVAVCITGGGTAADLNLPNATTVSEGAPTYHIKNVNPSTTLVVKDVCSCIIGTIPACCSTIISLYDNSTCQGAWTLGGLNAPEGVIALTTTCYTVGGAISAYTDLDGNYHVLSLCCTNGTGCAQTYKPTSSGFTVTGTPLCFCWCCEFSVGCYSCGWAITQLWYCHSSTCGSIGQNCGILYLVNCDSTCVCCIIDNMKAQCNSPCSGNWWSGSLGYIQTPRMLGTFETTMNDSAGCSMCAGRIWCINNKTTGMPTANLVYCTLCDQTFSYGNRRCWRSPIGLSTPCGNIAGTEVVLLTNANSTLGCNCWELFCLSPDGTFSRAHTGCGDTGACCLGSWANYTTNNFSQVLYVNCQWTAWSNHYNDGQYQLQKFATLCTNGANLCLKIPISSMVNSGAEGNTDQRFDFIACCLGIFHVSNTSNFCGYKEILRFCGTAPLTMASLCSYCCQRCMCCPAYTYLFGPNCDWHKSEGQCCYFCGSGTPEALFRGCGINQLMVCNTAACVVWWAPNGTTSCPYLLKWTWNCAACTLTPSCCLQFCNFAPTCVCCLSSYAIVFGSPAARACAHFTGGASIAICMCCATGTVNPIDCCFNFIGGYIATSAFYYCTGECRYLFTSYPSSCSYPVVSYDYSTYPATFTVMGCYNLKARGAIQNYNAATCRHIAYLYCCSGTGALDSEVVLSEYNPSTCTFTYGIGVADTLISRDTQLANACGYSIVQVCCCYNPVFVRTFGKVKLL